MNNIIHIHDEICGHASNTLEAVVAYALEHHYHKLIYTEHCPLDNNKIIFRPSHNDIKNLRQRIDLLNKKYSGTLLIEFGYEAEYPKVHREYFQNLIHDAKADYLIFGNHFYGDQWKVHRLIMDCTNNKEDLLEYYEYAKDAVASGIFSLFAHPDIWLGSYHKWDDAAIKLTDDLIQLCIKYDMPMGFNANGLHRERDGFNYPSELFWKRVVGTQAKVVIEADAHDLETLSEKWLASAQKEALRIGLKPNLIDDIPLKYFKNK